MSGSSKPRWWRITSTVFPIVVVAAIAFYVFVIQGVGQPLPGHSFEEANQQIEQIEGLDASIIIPESEQSGRQIRIPRTAVLAIAVTPETPLASRDRLIAWGTENLMSIHDREFADKTEVLFVFNDEALYQAWAADFEANPVAEPYTKQAHPFDSVSAQGLTISVTMDMDDLKKTFGEWPIDAPEVPVNLMAAS